MDLDLVLDLILSMGRVGSDFKSVKSYGFGFGVGFTLGHRLDRIMGLFFGLDLGSALDSFFSQIRI